MERTRRVPPERGFTLIEILVVIAIIGLIAGIVATNATGHFATAKVERAKTDAVQILTAAKTYWLRESVAPTLQDLIDPPPQLEGYEEVPLDPWQNPYQYQNVRSGISEFSLYSFGADGVLGGENLNADVGLLPDA